MNIEKIIKIILIEIIFFFTVAAFSTETNDQTTPKTQWTLFQIGIYPGFPESQDSSDVCGLRFGFPFSCSNKATNGLELSVLWSGTDYTYGTQLAPINSTKDIEGVQLGAVNCVRDNSSALQIGAANINYFNMSGVHIGVFNMTGKTTKGLQLGAYNFSEKIDGLQIGVLNIADSSGFQFGLINIIKDSWIPFLPIFNLYE